MIRRQLELAKSNQNSKLLIWKWLKNSIYIILGFFFLCPAIAFSQRTGDNKTQTDKEIQKNAEIALQEGKFEKALLLYKRLLEKDEKNPLLNFIVGYCYQNTDYGLEQSLSYLKNAAEYTAKDPENEAPLETKYYLGKAYHANYQFDNAIKVLKDMLSKTPKGETEFISKITKLIDYSDNGRMLTQLPSYAQIENVFDLNSKFSDKNPYINKQSDTIIFSSRRENPLVNMKCEDGQFDDNLFISIRKNDDWSVPYDLSQTINTVDHESPCWLSNYGDSMIIQRYEKTGGKLYLVTKNQNAEWNKPEKFGYPINDGSTTSFGSFSQDGKFLYFTSNRKGGFGGNDIYVSQYLGNNKWGEAKNLGQKINTKFNEESPVMDENKILFFSSEGYNSMGGYDIFACVLDETGNWQGSVNMGTPINSISNDFFFIPQINRQTAYVSSDREGTKGYSDIFKIDYADSLMQTAGIIAGQINCPTGTDAFANIEIRITNETDGKKLKPVRPTKSGSYSFILAANRTYIFEFYNQGNSFYNAKIILGENYSLIPTDQILVLKDITLEPKNLAINSFNTLETLSSVSTIEENTMLAYKQKFNEWNSENPDNISNENDLNNEEVYSIKIKNSSTKLSLNSFKEISGVKEYEDEKGTYTYYFGEFKYEWEAEIKLKMILENYPDATIFIFNNILEN